MYDTNAKADVITSTTYFPSDATPVLNKDDSNVQAAIDQLLRHLDEYTKEGSGWRLKRVVAFDLGIARYQPFRARSYFPTPKCIPPRTVITVKNDDNKCFMWTLLSVLYQPKNHPDRTVEYRNHIDKLKFE